MAAIEDANQSLSISKLFDVSRLTAVLTGGGSGIGLMITQVTASTPVERQGFPAANKDPGRKGIGR